VPVVSLARLLGPPFVEGDPSTPTFRVVILEVAGARLAVIVNDIVEERELVVRPLEQAAGTTGGFTTGAAPLADGRVMLVLDVPALFTEASRGGSSAGPDLATRVEASERRTRVLVVDDSITTRALEESVLGAAGYDVVTAVDGVDALRIIEQGEVALVVSDIEMPRMDGIELCMRIRGNRQLAELPVILVTSLDDPAHRARGLEAGADAYISKSSFDQDALLETVRQLLGRHAEMVR
jgi:two-component system chemotaxis sensor kinase CheA